jgi:hypothetical protein
VTYQNGYAEVGKIPPQVKLAILDSLAWSYQNRGEHSSLNAGITPTARTLLNTIRRYT